MLGFEPPGGAPGERPNFRAWTPVGEDPKAFVDRGGLLRRLETEAADAAAKRVREAAYPLIFKQFGSQMPRGKELKRVLARLGEDMARIEKTLG